MVDQTLNLRSKVMKGCCHRKPNQVWAPKHVPQRGNRLQLYSWVVLAFGKIITAVFSINVVLLDV